MIRNIVFDMGKVLMTYDPMVPCLRHAGSIEEARAVYEALFMAKEWEEKLDGCFINEAEMLKIAQSRLPTPELQKLCADTFADYHVDALEPIPGMEEIVEMLKRRGFGLYVLSNVGERIDKFKARLPGYGSFDGFLFSGEEKMIKPDPEIFRLLCRRFGLKPEECLFVDDRKKNTDAAAAVGMAGYLFENMDAAALKTYLEGLPEVQK